MKKNTKKTTTTRKPTRKPRATKVTTAPAQTAQPSAFVRGVMDGNFAVQRATGFVVGTTNGLVFRPVRNVFQWAVGSLNTAYQTTGKACQGLLESSRRKPANAARRRKS